MTGTTRFNFPLDPGLDKQSTFESRVGLADSILLISIPIALRTNIFTHIPEIHPRCVPIKDSIVILMSQ
jgi:hypothetical protein